MEGTRTYWTPTTRPRTPGRIDYVIGDHDDTAPLSLLDVAELLDRDFLNVQGDGMIAREAQLSMGTPSSPPTGWLATTLRLVHYRQ